MALSGAISMSTIIDNELEIMRYKVLFISDILSFVINLKDTNVDKLESDLATLGYPLLSETSTLIISVNKSTSDAIDGYNVNIPCKGYAYILDMLTSDITFDTLRTMLQKMQYRLTLFATYVDKRCI